MFVACGGAPFSTEGADGGDAGDGGGAGSGGKTTGGAGSTLKAGSSGKAGASAGRGGATASGGAIGVAGVLGISGSMTAEAGAPMTMECDAPSACPTSSVCLEATCNSGECGEKAVSDGPLDLQVPGDCQQLRCEGGNEVIALDPTDTDDKNPCTKDACGPNGTATHVAQTGQACSNGGLCSPEGKCEVCPNACPVPVDSCQVAYCGGGTCKVGPAPIDKLCPLVSSPTDSYGQCDGQGHCIDCTNSGACDEASTCSADQHCVPA